MIKLLSFVSVILLLVSCQDSKCKIDTVSRIQSIETRNNSDISYMHMVLLEL